MIKLRWFLILRPDSFT